VAAEVRTGGDRAMGHDWGGNIGLDEHAVRQGRVGGLVLFRGQRVQDGSINPQRANRRPSGGWRGSRGNTPGGVGVLITLGRNACEKRAARSVVGVAVSAWRTITSGRLIRGGSTLRAWSSPTSRDFGMDEAAPFAVGARSGDPESLRKR